MAELDFGSAITVEVLAPRNLGITSIELVDSTYIPALPGEPGETGETGLTGEAGLDGPQWAGEWEEDTGYASGSIVGYQGSSYISIADVPFNNLPTNTTYWNLLASKGDDAPKWRGEWVSGTTYNINDIVTHGGSAYIATIDTSSIPPASDWDLVVSKGDDGPKWLGDWVPTLAYKKDSVVRYGGIVYISLRDLPEGSSVLDEVNWEVMVDNGYELATKEEAIEGASETKIISPYSLAATLGDMHYQPSPEALWVINHNMNRYPKGSIVDSAGAEVEGAPEYVDRNTLNVRFVGGFSGIAYLS